MDDTIISTVGSLIGVVLFTLLGLFLKQQNKAKADAVIDKALPIVYGVVQEIANRTPNKVDDKVALGLKYLAEYAATHNITVTPEQEVRAKMVFDQLHAKSKEIK